ncbi:uncharacterized protein ACR2FA_011318 isoform 2-T3 [Aphomia sociella]
MSNRAWVTLATNDSYGLGALVLVHSLRRVNSAYPSVVLITPSVTEPMRDRLRAVYAEVVIVDVLDSRDAAHLALLQRPELGITFTKIHCWGLTQYEKCVFLDADTLIVQNCDELFEREELSAAPDVGWPDCFNSGVFVYKPSAETFDQLIKFAQERGSFDGGDQGLLNSFFSDWARGDINKHLPFLYNVTSAAFYSYLPALKHYGQNLKIIHFIGAAKPWLQQFNFESRTVEAPEHLREFLQLWWDLFVSQVHTQLDVAMTGVAGNLARVVPGAPGSQREALDELTRRQGWEAGNIDYMGADSFDNIWAKISQTLNQPRVSPPKQLPKEPTPPLKQPTPPLKEPTPPKQTAATEIASIEIAQEAVTIDAPSAAPVETPVVPEIPASVPTEVSTSVTTETAAPVEASAPVLGEAPPPAEALAPVPAEVSTPAPVEVSSPAPAKVSTPAPVEVSSPAPVEVSTPAPVEVSTPAPAEVSTPASAEASTPAPTEAATPESAKVSAPVTAETPVSVPVEASVPAAAESTAPVIVEASLPVSADASALPAVEAPAPAQAPVPVAVSTPASASVQDEVHAPVETLPVLAEPTVTTDVPATVEVPTPVVVESAVVPATVEAPAPVEIPATVETPTAEIPVSVEAVVPQKEETAQKTDKPAVPPTPPVTPKSTPEGSTPVTETAPVLIADTEKAPEVPQTAESVSAAPASPALAVEAPAAAALPESSPEKPASVTDSPPLANTPSKEVAPPVPAAKSTEEAAQETRL